MFHIVLLYLALSSYTKAAFSLLAMASDPTTSTVSKRSDTTCSSMTATKRVYYQLRPLTKHFGMEALGCDMTSIDLSDQHFLQELRQDLIQHRVLLFRKQKNLSGQRQVDISNALGTVESTFYKHPRSPHPDIFRVSNNEEEGCTGVGRSGWHIDGTFQMRPFSYQTMYFPSVSRGGDTYFIPLHEFYDSLPAKTRQRYDQLWMVTDRRQAPVHPLVYQHPFRNETTMLFHCGKPFVSGWFQDRVIESDDGSRLQRVVNTHELLPSEPIQAELTKEIESKMDELGLKMQWQAGDFMMNDNLGLAHFASDGTQEDPEEVGLRILHRTTIVGGPETVPQKVDGRQSFTTL